MDREKLERLKLFLYYAHQHSFHNEQEIKRSVSCICFHCERWFYSRQVTMWCDEDNVGNRTARCPYCGVDSVLGDDEDDEIYTLPVVNKLMHIQFFGEGIDNLEKIPYIDDGIMWRLNGKYCRDCIVFADKIDPDALAIIFHLIDNPMFEGAKIRIMPDVHAAKDIVVGFTVPFADHVNPDHVGGDIGCSVSTVITDLPICPENYPQIEKTIRENVKFGMTVHSRSVYPQAELYRHLQSRLQEARQQWPEMVGMADVSERGITAMLKRIELSEHMFYHSIGTVGGGNHFVEVGMTPDGNYAFTVHCGSRNFGQMVWKYWKRIAMQPDNANSGFLTGDNMRGYITDMVIAQAYAEYNHMVIDRLVMDAICSVSSVQANILDRIYTTHNYIDFSMKMIRKGAVAAPKGKKLVIPFNMHDGLIVARGKGNKEWNCSAPHGAGRLLSRSEAKEQIDMEEYREMMVGIYSTSVGIGTIDESPKAYKDTEEILNLIGDTVDVEYFIRPVINMKATNSYDPTMEIDMNEEAY